MAIASGITSSVVFETIDDVARAGGETPFVGRESAVERLMDAVARAGEHEPSGWLVGGDAGVGKTRYLREVGRRVGERGVRVVTGRCVDLGSGGLPYLPFAEVVAQLATDDDLAALPALGALIGVGQSDADLSDREADIDRRLPLFDAVRLLLATVAERDRALLVVLEDVHWADKSSRDLLHYLLARLRSEPVVIVASFRTDDLHRRHPLRQLVPELVRLPGVERIDLPPFDVDELRSYLVALTGTPVDESTVTAVLDRSEGNAYFAEELMGWRQGHGDGLPAGLADILLARVERLGQDAQHVVRLASVAGRRVTDDVLVEIGGLPPREVDAALREAFAQLVLVPDVAPDGSAGYAFRHALLREAVYEDLLPGERARLHAAYVALLSSPERATRHGTASALAYHATAAHDLPRALEASLRAAAEARASRAPAETSVHLAQALSVWDAVPGAAAVAGISRIRLGLQAATAAADAGEPARAVALAQEAVDLAETPDDGTTPVDAELVALCLTQLASYLYLVDRDVECYRASSRARELLRGRDLSQTVVQAAAMYARAADGLLPGKDEVAALAEVRASAEEALHGAHELSLNDVEADASITLASLDLAGGDRDGALERLASARDLARAGGHHGTRAAGRVQLGHAEVLRRRGRRSARAAPARGRAGRPHRPDLERIRRGGANAPGDRPVRRRTMGQQSGGRGPRGWSPARCGRRPAGDGRLVRAGRPGGQRCGSAGHGAQAGVALRLPDRTGRRRVRSRPPLVAGRPRPRGGRREGRHRLRQPQLGRVVPGRHLVGRFGSGGVCGRGRARPSARARDR